MASKTGAIYERDGDFLLWSYSSGSKSVTFRVDDYEGYMGASFCDIGENRFVEVTVTNGRTRAARRSITTEMSVDQARRLRDELDRAIRDAEQKANL